MGNRRINRWWDSTVTEISAVEVHTEDRVTYSNEDMMIQHLLHITMMWRWPLARFLGKMSNTASVNSFNTMEESEIEDGSRSVRVPTSLISMGLCSCKGRWEENLGWPEGYPHPPKNNIREFEMTKTCFVHNSRFQVIDVPIGICMNGLYTWVAIKEVKLAVCICRPCRK